MLKTNSLISFGSPPTHILVIIPQFTEETAEESSLNSKLILKVIYGVNINQT